MAEGIRMIFRENWPQLSQITNTRTVEPPQSVWSGICQGEGVCLGTALRLEAGEQ